MLDVVCVGEILIDFISMNENVTIAESDGFYKNPGGAPANVAAGISRLGYQAGFIGKTGNDPLGMYLKSVMEKQGVDVSHMAADDRYRTTLAFVALRPDGVKDIAFFRNPGADMMLEAADIPEDYIKGFKILHFGSVSLANEPSKNATLTALDYADKNGLLISYDPNLRLGLWDNEKKAKKEINDGFARAHIVKISDEEYPFITGKNTVEECAEYILGMGPKLVVVTLGADGCYYSNGKDSGYIPGFPVQAIETTGAGDAFVAALLTKLSERLHSGFGYEIDERMINDMRFANAAGALATTKIGAIPSLPEIEDVNQLCGGN